MALFGDIPADVGAQMADTIVRGIPSEGASLEWYRPTSVCINMMVAERLEIEVPFRVRRYAELIDPRQLDEN